MRRLSLAFTGVIVLLVYLAYPKLAKSLDFVYLRPERYVSDALTEEQVAYVAGVIETILYLDARGGLDDALVDCLARQPHADLRNNDVATVATREIYRRQDSQIAEDTIFADYTVAEAIIDRLSQSCELDEIRKYWSED